MLKKFFLLSLFISSIIFFYFVAIFYLSEKNIKQINTNRSNLSEIINDNTKDLPLIKNDTNIKIELIKLLIKNKREGTVK